MRRWRYIPGMNGDSRNIHQPVADGVHDQFGGPVNAESVHDVGAMHGNGVGAEVELLCDLFVRFAVADQLQDFHFTRGEACAALSLEVLLERELAVEDGFAVDDAADDGAEFEVESI